MNQSKMTYITLTTDFGTQDWYAGALKGAIARVGTDIQLCDISHNIAAFDIVQAALVARNTWIEFPEGTIHVLAVNCVYGPHYQFVALRHKGHYFIAPDNGLLALLFEEIPAVDIRCLDTDATAHFSVKNVVADAIAKITSGIAFEEIGQPLEGALIQRIHLQPVVTKRHIRGTVIHIDQFENVVLNITREAFEKASQNRSFSLYYKRNDALTTLSSNYCDVVIGEPLCLFNSAGFLEIAVNFGKAATLLSLKVEDAVEVIFE